MPTSTRKPRSTAAERRDARLKAHNDAADDALYALVQSTTQGEWLAIRRALDMTRPEIGAEVTLTLLAMAYVKEKRDHGAASWDVLLDMTDAELQRLHGFKLDVSELEPLETAEAPSDE